MSTGFECHCEERQKPLAERNWRVTKRNFHTSAFSGYRRTYSDYSTVLCLSCMRIGRTKANYVTGVKDIKPGEGGY
jgi:hypothetical protein